jgi:hypothetical protein
MVAAQWVNRRTGSLLVLASLVAVLAFLFGNEYVSHGHAAEEAHAEEGAAVEEEHAEEEGEHAEEEEAGSQTQKVGGAILISAAGAGLVPLGLLLVRRRPREEEELSPTDELGRRAMAAPPPAAGRNDLEGLLRPTVALLSAGAAVIHFAVIPGHWDEYWGQGLFFVVAAVAQLLWALWIIVAPSRLIYLAGAAGNAAIVVMWIVTRTAGIPAGPGAGEAEAVEFADTLSTVFEVIIVVGALALARNASQRGTQPTKGLAPTVLLALVVTALTAASLLSLVEL